MIEKFIKRGVLRGKQRKFVTTIEIPYDDKVAHLFFVDADRNLINPHVYVKARLLEFLQNTSEVKMGMLQKFVRDLDEDAVQKDYVLLSLTLVIEQGENKFVISVSSDGIRAMVFDHWAFDEGEQVYPVCEFENGGSKFHYIGSGAAIGAEAQLGKNEDLLLITLDTQLHLKDSCGVSVVSPDFFRSRERNYPDIFNNVQSLLSSQKFSTGKDVFVAMVYSSLDLTQDNHDFDLN